MRSASASSHCWINRVTSARIAFSAGDGSGCRGTSAPVFAARRARRRTVVPSRCRSALPIAMMPTPYSGSQRIWRSESWQAAAVRHDRGGTRRSATRAARSRSRRRCSCSAPSRSRDAGAGAGRHTCCISRSDDAAHGPVSAPSRGGQASRNDADVRPRSLQRRQHAAHRAEGAVRQRRLLLPALVLPAIAVREPVGRHRRRLERRRRHAERLQDVAAHVVAVRHA